MAKRLAIVVVCAGILALGVALILRHRHLAAISGIRSAEKNRPPYDQEYNEWHRTSDVRQATAPIMAINLSARENGDIKPEDVQLLLEYMQNSAWPLRQLALSVAQKATSVSTRKALLPSVVNHLADEVPDVRLEAVYTLRVIGTVAEAGYLKPLVKDSDPKVAQEASKAIATLSQRQNSTQ
jgi:hypothetical protein